MAKIFYSMCGEGRGHAARVRSLVEHLRSDHELILFAPEQAYEYLIAHYPHGKCNVRVQHIPGLRFHYAQGALDLWRSLAAAGGYLWKLKALVRLLARQIEAELPDLIVTDFEPALPRAARLTGFPYLSLDHQHFLVASDLAELPLALRSWARLMRFAVRWHHRWQTETVVSSFFHPPLTTRRSRVTQVGPLLRSNIVAASPSRGDYVVSYLRPHAPSRILEFLSASGRDVRVYGLGEQLSVGRLRFFKFDEARFTDDLAGAAALIGAAGNQTIGEALYLGKPVLALPEAKHHEQRINAHFVHALKVGQGHMAETVSDLDFRLFWKQCDAYAEVAAQRFQGTCNGTPAALQALKRHLPTSVRPLPRTLLGV